MRFPQGTTGIGQKTLRPVEKVRILEAWADEVGFQRPQKSLDGGAIAETKPPTA